MAKRSSHVAQAVDRVRHAADCRLHRLLVASHSFTSDRWVEERLGAANRLRRLVNLIPRIPPLTCKTFGTGRCEPGTAARRSRNSGMPLMPTRRRPEASTVDRPVWAGRGISVSVVRAPSKPWRRTVVVLTVANRSRRVCLELGVVVDNTVREADRCEGQRVRELAGFQCGLVGTESPSRTRGHCAEPAAIETWRGRGFRRLCQDRRRLRP